MYKILEYLPGIPRILSTGTKDRRPFIVMERMSITLEDYRKDDLLPKTESFIADLAGKLLKLLRSIHLRGIVHGDIKPANIGLRFHNSHVIPFVFDFGKATRWQAGAVAPPPTTMTGTLIFASVNALAGEVPSPRDDIISLVYTLIYVIAHSLPWTWDPRCTAKELSWSTRLHSIVAMKKIGTILLNGGVPDDLVDLLEHASSLQFGDIPDYAQFISVFERLAMTTSS
ncbi:kinase-like protein [Athelia psychrophila]|uniref:Kinase-like protein n=1 Tax=Athelia psychrophila TaxID=1759441 RepID=A0A166M706_9AGAM|nr:kinase-like protein [Fibularhizoctonia sp. CBS 109695]